MGNKFPTNKSPLPSAYTWVASVEFARDEFVEPAVGLTTAPIALLSTPMTPFAIFVTSCVVPLPAVMILSAVPKASPCKPVSVIS